MRYSVIDREQAEVNGHRTTGEHNRFALMAGSDVLCWGFKRENLEAIATKRNEQLSSLQDKMNRSEDLEA